ncbi:flavin reductase family protein [Streptomyces hyaluromycini]|uniref:Flavin reductase family protein n=1 Tax=Streptomyces hyaluromycini TaxID=1377993 RepID=A0ABV1WRE7_9ACTN
MTVSVNPADMTVEARRTMLLASIVPRPIAWTSTTSTDGTRNLAPFSYCTVVSTTPPMLSLTLERKDGGEEKDTLRNLRATGDFVVNILSGSLTDAMVATSGEYPQDVDEFAVAGVTPLAADVVRADRVAEAPISLECRLVHILQPGSDTVVIGRVERCHFDDTVIDGEGNIDPGALQPVGRLGRAFAVIDGLLSIRA